MNTKKMVMISLLGLVLMTSMVSAFGVASEYWVDRPLRMYPGETTTVYLDVENAELEDIVVIAEITSPGDQIARLGFESNRYTVPADTEIRVPVIITIPSDTTLGGINWINVDFTRVDAGTGTVFLVQGSNARFPVEIVNEVQSTNYVAPPAPEVEEETSSNTFWYILLIIAAGIIIYFGIMKKKGHVPGKPAKKNKK